MTKMLRVVSKEVSLVYLVQWRHIEAGRIMANETFSQTTKRLAIHTLNETYCRLSTILVPEPSWLIQPPPLDNVCVCMCVCMCVNIQELYEATKIVVASAPCKHLQVK